jgi:hypothetical protein
VLHIIRAQESIVINSEARSDIYFKMDKRIFMVLLFTFLVTLSVIVLVTCIWKLIKLFAKVRVEQQIEDLEALNCKNNAGAPEGSKTSPTKNPYFYMSPKEARKLRRLSILAGFDRVRSTRRKSASCSPFRSRSNPAPDHDYEREMSEDSSIKNSRTDIRFIRRSSTKRLGLFANVLTCGCCIPIHEQLSKLLLQSSERKHKTKLRTTKYGGILSKRKDNSEVESTSLASQPFTYSKRHDSDEHLELVEKDCNKMFAGVKGMDRLWKYKYLL